MFVTPSVRLTGQKYDSPLPSAVSAKAFAPLFGVASEQQKPLLHNANVKKAAAEQ